MPKISAKFLRGYPNGYTK